MLDALTVIFVGAGILVTQTTGYGRLSSGLYFVASILVFLRFFQGKD